MQRHTHKPLPHLRAGARWVSGSLTVALAYLRAGAQLRWLGGSPGERPIDSVSEPPWACLLDIIHLIDLTDLTDLSELKDLIDLFGLKDLTELIMLTSWSYFRNEPEWLLGDSHSAHSAVGRNVGLPLMSPSSSEGVGSIPGGRTKNTCRPQGRPLISPVVGGGQVAGLDSGQI